MFEFRWNDANLDHIAEHGVTPWETEQVINSAKRPYPEYRGDGKWLVRGQTKAGRYL